MPIINRDVDAPILDTEAAMADDVENDLSTLFNLINYDAGGTGLDDANIQDNGITGSAKLKDNSVTGAKLVNASVSASKLADDSFEGRHIGDGVVNIAQRLGKNATGGIYSDITAVTWALITQHRFYCPGGISKIHGSFNILLVGSGSFKDTQIRLKVVDNAGTIYATSTAVGGIAVTSSEQYFNDTPTVVSNLSEGWYILHVEGQVTSGGGYQAGRLLDYMVVFMR